MLKTFYCFLCACFMAITPALALETIDINCHEGLEQFEHFIQTADKPVILYFWAPYNPPCMKLVYDAMKQKIKQQCLCTEMQPIFDEVAQALNEHYLFVRVNIEGCTNNRELAKKYGVTSIPTFKVIKDNTVLRTFGHTSKELFIDYIENAIHQQFTQYTLLSAIHTNDRELVATCLARQDIDVNAISQMSIPFPFPMTPLIWATALNLSGQTSLEIVSMLLNAGAQIDMKIDFPVFDSSMTVIGQGELTARFMPEKYAEGLSEEELAKLNYMLRQELLEHQVEYKERASILLELFQTKQD